MKDKIKTLVSAGISCFWIKTYDESDTVLFLHKTIQETEISKATFNEWSNTSGIRKIPFFIGEEKGTFEPQKRDVSALIEIISTKAGLRREEVSENYFVLKSVDDIFQKDPRLSRGLNDIFNRKLIPEKKNVVFLLSETSNIPNSISSFTYFLDCTENNLDEFYEALKNAEAFASSKNKIAVNYGNAKQYKESYTKKEKEQLRKAVSGLSRGEIRQLFRESLAFYKEISLDFVMKYKIEKVSRNGILDFKIPQCSMSDIGGNNAIKKWLNEQKFILLSDDAESYGLEPPKGMVLIGIPGTSKTMMAEAFAGELKVPFLKLNMSKIMSKLVGESEKNIEKALSLAKNNAPCVLLLDEIEKILGGAGPTGGSNAVDGGVTNRIMASLLSFMDNNKNVFVVMTSNDISAMPPEFTRASRIDAHWYFGLPDINERFEIAKIHSKKYEKLYAGDEIPTLIAKYTNGYTGAEIKEVAKNIARKMYMCLHDTATIVRSKEQVVLESVNEVTPVSVSSKEKIAALENWCKTRAKNASGEKKKTEAKKVSVARFNF